MESPNLGAGHEHSHLNHASTRIVATKFAKFAVEKVLISIGRYRIANCLEDERRALIVRFAVPGYRLVAMT